MTFEISIFAFYFNHFALIKGMLLLNKNKFWAIFFIHTNSLAMLDVEKFNQLHK